MHKDYDVVIVGAGIVGMLLAGLLSRHHLRVAIIEAKPIQRIPLEEGIYHLRVSALNLTGKDLFSSLGVWGSILSAHRLCPFEKMFVWDELGKGEIKFDCTQIAQPSLGYIIENAVIQNALFERLEHDSQIIFLQAQPIGLSHADKGITLHYQRPNSSEESLTAELLVGADGAHSWVRAETRIDSYQWPYHHHALVTTVHTEYSHEKTAWQCFLPEGPLALLPLFADQTCSVVWSATPSRIHELESMDDRRFNIEISKAFGYRLGNIQKISQHQSVPLFMRHAKKYIEQRVALVGDALRTIHPLAGQGLNLGIAEASVLADNILASKERQGDCGAYTGLRKYERARKFDNWLMIFGMEFFKRLFEADSFLTVQARSLGLEMVNKFNPIKNRFIEHAR